MTTPATASFLREATSPEALTRARRRLLTAHPDSTSANTLTTADPITRVLLAESVRETLELRLAADRPYGTYDDSAQDTTHLAGDSSRTTTTATITSREPLSASPTRAS